MLGKKALVIGLDCLTPQFVFGKYRKSMPTVSAMLKNSIWGRMESTLPPITCPAWASMVTSKNPGRLGIYGFRNRSDHSYNRLSIATSRAVSEDALWDVLGKKKKQSVVVAVPPSYPPKPINGVMVGCFLTPDTESDYTYPGIVKKEIEANLNEYRIDVRNFRTDDKERLLKDIYGLSRNRFDAAKFLMKNKPWDFFMFVDMGPDRMHHGFWRFCDPGHSKYKKKNKFENAIRDYYAFLDGMIKDILKLIDDDTTVYIVSDHGAKRIDGCFCINEWLIQKGYLSLKSYPDKVTRISHDIIDWPKTYAWGEGGYYGRIFFNIKEREPQGIIPKSDRGAFEKRLMRDLSSIKYVRSKAKKTVVYRPGDIYPEVRGIAPDLLVFFGDLVWRSAGSVGHKKIYTFENDTGPDDANHDYHGIFIMHSKRIKTPREVRNIKIYDVAPSVLYNMGIKVPDDMEGKVLK